jgi:hypothetical protein
VFLERPLRLGTAPPPQARLLAAAERRGRRAPRLAIARETVRPQPGAERDQRRQVADRLDRPGLGDADEPVRVQVVAEQQRRVRIGGLEEARPAVVEQVALVDRLEPERVPLLAQGRENGYPGGLRAQRVPPQPAFLRGLAGDRLPEIRRYSQPASSFVQ